MSDPTAVSGPGGLQILHEAARQLMHQIPGLSYEDADRLTHQHADRIIATFASQMASLKPEAGGTGWPGVTDTMLSLPRLAQTIPGLLGALHSKIYPNSTANFGSELSTLAEKHMPDFVGRAEERQAKLSDMINKEMDVPEATTPVQHLEDAAGYMLSSPWASLPKMASKAPAMARTALGSAPEYLFPTIKPSVGNYMGGTLFGGGVGAATDILSKRAQEEEGYRSAEENLADRFVTTGHLMPEPERNFADGGRVAKLNQMLKAISINPHATASRLNSSKKVYLDDPIENIKYAANVARSNGHLDDVEHADLHNTVNQYLQGDATDEQLGDKLTNLHERLFGNASLLQASEPVRASVERRAVVRVPSAMGTLGKYPWEENRGGQINAK